MAIATQDRPTDTRAQILDAAQSAILEKGFASTSIDELAAVVGISRSGFFYHFRDKGALARALLERYIEDEDAMFDEMFARADELVQDPLYGFLAALKMLAEAMADLPALHPGCLVASICYQERLFDGEVRELNRRAVLAWRRRFSARLHEIAACYPPRIDVEFDDVADMMSVVADGGIILSKIVNDKTALPSQIMLYREFVRAVFLGAEMQEPNKNTSPRTDRP